MKKMAKTLNYWKIFLLVALVNAIYGCVGFDNFNTTEKPYVDKASVELYIGEGSGDLNQIQLKSAPEGRQYTWTSLDPSIATVTQTGFVTALKEGFAVITVASGNDQTNVNVWVRNWVPLEDFTLDKQQVEVKRLDKMQIVAASVPQNASVTDIRWTSSNPEVATVYDNGWIVGNEIGNAIITATAANGKEHQVAVEVVPAVARFKITAANIPGYTTTTNKPSIGYSSHQTAYPLLNLFDGNITTFWHGAYSGDFVSTYPHWFIVDLRRTVVITELMMQKRQEGSGQNFKSATGFYFYTCPDVTVDQNDPVDGYPWVLQDEFAFNSLTNAEQRYKLPVPLEARYVKIYIDTKHKDPAAANNYIQLAEFGIYGY